MRRISIYKHYSFGYNYGLLLRDGMNGYTRDDAIEVLSKFFANLAELDLQVTSVAAGDLRVFLEEINSSEETNSVDANLAKRICAATEKLDTTLDAELKLRKAYVLTKKRYPLDTLLATPEELLAKGAWDTLSDTAKQDFRLAAIQVALSQPTASAFHLMRCLEEQVKVLYFAFKKTKRLEKPMWGPMTTELKAKRAPKPTEKLLNHLDGMRIHFRNPTQHPNAFYSLDEAQDLLNQTITALNMVADELPKPAAA